MIRCGCHTPRQTFQVQVHSNEIIENKQNQMTLIIMPNVNNISKTFKTKFQLKYINAIANDPNYNSMPNLDKFGPDHFSKIKHNLLNMKQKHMGIITISSHMHRLLQIIMSSKHYYDRKVSIIQFIIYNNHHIAWYHTINIVQQGKLEHEPQVRTNT